MKNLKWLVKRWFNRLKEKFLSWLRKAKIIGMLKCYLRIIIHSEAYNCRILLPFIIEGNDKRELGQCIIKIQEYILNDEEYDIESYFKLFIRDNINEDEAYTTIINDMAGKRIIDFPIMTSPEMSGHEHIDVGEFRQKKIGVYNDDIPNEKNENLLVSMLNCREILDNNKIPPHLMTYWIKAVLISRIEERNFSDFKPLRLFPQKTAAPPNFNDL